MYKSLKLNQRSIFDLIPGMTVIFSDDDFTATAHSEAVYLAWIRALCMSILSIDYIKCCNYLTLKGPRPITTLLMTSKIQSSQRAS